MRGEPPDSDLRHLRVAPPFESIGKRRPHRWGSLELPTACFCSTSGSLARLPQWRSGTERRLDGDCSSEADGHSRCGPSPRGGSAAEQRRRAPAVAGVRVRPANQTLHVAQPLRASVSAAVRHWDAPARRPRSYGRCAEGPATACAELDETALTAERGSAFGRASLARSTGQDADRPATYSPPAWLTSRTSRSCPPDM